MGILSLRGYSKVLSIDSKVLSIGPMLSTLEYSGSYRYGHIWPYSQNDPLRGKMLLFALT